MSSKMSSFPKYARSVQVRLLGIRGRSPYVVHSNRLNSKTHRVYLRAFISAREGFVLLLVKMNLLSQLQPCLCKYFNISTQARNKGDRISSRKEGSSFFDVLLVLTLKNSSLLKTNVLNSNYDNELKLYICCPQCPSQSQRDRLCQKSQACSNLLTRQVPFIPQKMLLFLDTLSGSKALKSN